MHPELKAYLDEFEVKAQARFEASARLFARHDELLSKLVTGASTPQPARSAVVASNGDLTVNATVVAVVPDTFSSAIKAQEVIAAPCSAFLDSIDLMPMTCSMAGSTQVACAANATTSVRLEPLVDPIHQEVDAEIVTPVATTTDVFSATTQAQETLASANDSSPVSIVMMPVTCSTECLTQEVEQLVPESSISTNTATAEVLSSAAVTSDIIPSVATAANLVSTKCLAETHVYTNDSVQLLIAAIDSADETHATATTERFEHQPWPPPVEVQTSHMGQLFRPSPWPSFRPLSVTSYPEETCSSIHCQSHGGPCLSPWLLRLMFRDVPREEPVHYFPDPEMQLEYTIGFSLVVSLIRKMASPQSVKSSYRPDCATKGAAVQNTEKHFTQSVQCWALVNSAGFRKTSLEELSVHSDVDYPELFSCSQSHEVPFVRSTPVHMSLGYGDPLQVDCCKLILLDGPFSYFHGAQRQFQNLGDEKTFATQTTYLISCMSRPCPWPSFDCFHEGSQLRYLWQKIPYVMHHFASTPNSLTQSLRCRQSVHLKLLCSSSSSNCQAVHLWSELPEVEFQSGAPGSSDPSLMRKSWWCLQSAHQKPYSGTCRQPHEVSGFSVRLVWLQFKDVGSPLVSYCQSNSLEESFCCLLGAKLQSGRPPDRVIADVNLSKQASFSLAVIQERYCIGTLLAHAGYLTCFRPAAISREAANYTGIQFYPDYIVHSHGGIWSLVIDLEQCPETISYGIKLGLHPLCVRTSSTLMVLRLEWPLLPCTDVLVGNLRAYTNSGDYNHQHSSVQFEKLWPTGTEEEIFDHRWSAQLSSVLRQHWDPGDEQQYPEDTSKYYGDILALLACLMVQHIRSRILMVMVISNSALAMSGMTFCTCYNQDQFQEGRSVIAVDVVFAHGFIVHECRLSFDHNYDDNGYILGGGVIAFATVFVQGLVGRKYYFGFDYDGYCSIAFFTKVPINHNTYFNRVSIGHDYYYLNRDCFSKLAQVHLNHGCYLDIYHGDPDMIKNLQAPWDPGQLFMIAAWGQAAFQEGRNVRDLPYAHSYVGLAADSYMGRPGYTQATAVDYKYLKEKQRTGHPGLNQAKVASAAREQRARLYIMHRCVSMLVSSCWKNYP